MMRSLYLIAGSLLLTSCATEQAMLTSPAQLFAQATDTPAAVVPLPAGGKYKFNGPVTITYQVGTGNVATPTAADNRKAGQRGGAAATAPGASSMATTKKAGVPWWVFLLVAVGGAVGWEYLSHRGLLKWLPWRVGAG